MDENATLPLPDATASASPSTPASNDVSPKTDIPAKTSILEKMGDTLGNLFERNGVVYKRGRGKPRSDGTPKASDVPVNLPATVLPALAAPTASENNGAVDKALVKKCTSAVIKSAIGFFDKILYRKAVQATGDKDFAKKTVEDVSLSAAEKEAFEDIAVLCAELGKIDSRYLVIGTAFTITTAAGGRYAMAIMTLNEEIKKRNGKGGDGN